MMTLDLLLMTIRQNLEAEAENPTADAELILFGVPGDAVMRKVLAEKGGQFTIKVTALPDEMVAKEVEKSNISTYLQRMQGAL